MSIISGVIQRPGNLAEEIGRRTPFERLDEEVFLNLLMTRERVAMALAEVYRERGLSPPQYNVLRILMAQDTEGLPMQRIAERMITRDSDMTRLVDALESQRHVERRRDQQDRRVTRVTLTASGRRLMRELEQPVIDVYQEYFAHLGQAKLSLLNQLLFEVRHPKSGEPESDG